MLSWKEPLGCLGFRVRFLFVIFKFRAFSFVEVGAITDPVTLNPEPLNLLNPTTQVECF